MNDQAKYAWLGGFATFLAAQEAYVVENKLQKDHFYWVVRHTEPVVALWEGDAWRFASADSQVYDDLEIKVIAEVRPPRTT